MFFKNHKQMLAIVQFEKHIINTQFLDNIIYKFSNQYKVVSIILIEINKHLKVIFYYTIFSFNFTIYLEIKNDIKSIFNIYKIEK